MQSSSEGVNPLPCITAWPSHTLYDRLNNLFKINSDLATNMYCPLCIPQSTNLYSRHWLTQSSHRPPPVGAGLHCVSEVYLWLLAAGAEPSNISSAAPAKAANTSTGDPSPASLSWQKSIPATRHRPNTQESADVSIYSPLHMLEHVI